MVGAETAYIVGNTLLLGGKGLGLPPGIAIIGSGVFGGYIGGELQGRLEDELREQRQSEKKQNDNDEYQKRNEE